MRCFSEKATYSLNKKTSEEIFRYCAYARQDYMDDDRIFYSVPEKDILGG